MWYLLTLATIYGVLSIFLGRTSAMLASAIIVIASIITYIIDGE